MSDTAKFIGALEGRSCLVWNGDGSATVKLTVPSSEIAGVATLLRFREQPLSITIHCPSLTKG